MKSAAAPATAMASRIHLSQKLVLGLVELAVSAGESESLVSIVASKDEAVDAGIKSLAAAGFREE
jgi:hypothetical protein